MGLLNTAARRTQAAPLLVAGSQQLLLAALAVAQLAVALPGRLPAGGIGLTALDQLVLERDGANCGERRQTGGRPVGSMSAGGNAAATQETCFASARGTHSRMPPPAQACLCRLLARRGAAPGLPPPHPPTRTRPTHSWRWRERPGCCPAAAAGRPPARGRWKPPCRRPCGLPLWLAARPGRRRGRCRRPLQARTKAGQGRVAPR